MLDLTFGEQVKIVLSRKGMTIKELAEIIEAETGKKMSRQNLTQRLGRDNFQEQDMRMIAKILDCPFQLNILDEDQSIENNYNEREEEQVLRKRRKVEEKKLAAEFAEEEAVQMELPLYIDEPEMPAVEGTPVAESVAEEAVIEEPAYEEPVAEEPAVEESGYEAAPAIEEPMYEETLMYEEGASYEDAPTIEEPMYEETPAYEEPSAYVEQPVYEEEPVYEEQPVAETPVQEADQPEKKEPEKKEHEKKETGWFSSLRRRMKREDKHTQDAQKTSEKEAGAETAIEEKVSEDMEQQEFIEESGYTEGMAKEEFQDSGAYIDTLVQEANVQNSDWYPQVEEAYREEVEAAAAVPNDEEDLEHGDVNPYTGHEYETNSVRVHPTKIGYVQVYDRAEHAWADMTEWAFLGYQEQKKALLGKDYEPPIYLD